MRTRLVHLVVIGASVTLGYLLASLGRATYETTPWPQLAAAQGKTANVAGGAKQETKAQPGDKDDKKVLRALAGFGPTPSMKKRMPPTPPAEAGGKRGAG